MMKPAKLYIAYTQDDEVVTLGTVEQLARWFDTTPNNICSLATHFKKGDIKKPRVKFYRVDDLEEAPENED
ncbi:hypothetical protein HF863_11020 [Lactobacillus agilis]|uniref:Uncharacterized protein n=1 Tax=Ligilactobacillus agilis TaxID=1601 RepID=A0A848CFH9_9LACO|nr:hypothetical protein [Ligilactobacillus agilis]NME43266.1 hypothetical protein [Ligilactobacillus agilis]